MLGRVRHKGGQTRKTTISVTERKRFLSLQQSYVLSVGAISMALYQTDATVATAIDILPGVRVLHRFPSTQTHIRFDMLESEHRKDLERRTGCGCWRKNPKILGVELLVTPRHTFHQFFYTKPMRDLWCASVGIGLLAVGCSSLVQTSTSSQARERWASFPTR